MRAKFKCVHIVPDSGSGFTKRVLMTAVWGAAGENKEFSKKFPAGEVDLWVTEGTELFVEGKEYYLDFIPVK